jgi:hypothetical protein
MHWRGLLPAPMLSPHGWRSQDAYDTDREARRRALPWRQRYNWPGLALFAVIVALALAFLWASVARAAPIN